MISNNKTLKKDERRETTPHKERIFSIDLKSTSALRNLSLDNGTHDEVLIEGTLGTLKRAEFVEELLPELTGTNGVLRVDLAREELAGAHTQT